jgi:hypothetical protein
MALAEVTELLPLASATADALGRLIARTKAIGYRAPTADPAAPAARSRSTSRDGAEQEGPAAHRGLGGADRRRARRPLVPLPAGARAGPAAAAPDLRRDRRDRGRRRGRGRGGADRGGQPRRRGAADGGGAVPRPAAGRSLPGQRPRAAPRPVRRAARAGGAAGRAGRRAAARAADRSAPRRAVLRRGVPGHLRLRSAVYPLVERLFDSDYGVRACAIEALATYPARDSIWRWCARATRCTARTSSASRPPPPRSPSSAIARRSPI